ncbi:MAG: hypothetical protein H7338_02590 [Candidatus Sericytochromatia bacterium]|nr:hypothetical protein [Candidatus Sericytochromatia bacterium]
MDDVRRDGGFISIIAGSFVGGKVGGTILADGGVGGNGGNIHLQSMHGNIDISSATLSANGGNGLVPGSGGNVSVRANNGHVKAIGANISVNGGHQVLLGTEAVLKAASKAIRYSQHVEPTQRASAVEAFERLIHAASSTATVTQAVVLGVVEKFGESFPHLVGQVKSMLRL